MNKSTTLYSRDVAAVPMLSPTEQHDLACRFARGRDPKDAQRLMLANLRLVLSIAASLAGSRRDDLMDLVQEGNAGLMVAIDRFDPTRGLKLSAYASIWIRAFVLRHLMEMGRVVRSTSTREGRRLFHEHSLPTDASLDAPIGHDADGAPRATRLDFLRDDESGRPDVATEVREEHERLRGALARLQETLNARERVILESRLLCDEPKPLRQLGSKLSLSGERVRQLETEMVNRLRVLVAGTRTDDQPRA